MADRDNQHYVPRVYLKNFLDPELVRKSKHQVWVYKQDTQPEPRGLSRVGASHRFYDMPGAPDLEVAEKAFSKIETVAGQHLPKLVRGDMSLSSQEKAELAWFLAASMNRTPFAFDLSNAATIGTFLADVKSRLADDIAIQRIADDLVAEGRDVTAHRVRELCEQMVRGDVVLEQRDRGFTIVQMFRSITYWGGCFEKMAWALCEAPPDAPFITTDSPVNVNDEGAMRQTFSEYRGPTRQVRFHFPVSPRFALTGAFVPARDQLCIVDSNWVQVSNTAMIARAHREVYASFRSDSLALEVNRRHSERQPTVPSPKVLLD